MKRYTAALRGLMTIIAIVLAPSLALADCTGAPVATKGVTGFQEAVISVADLDAALAVWRDVGKFEILCQDQANADVATFWGLPKDTRIDEIVLRKPGLGRGFIRLVKFNGVKQEQIRSSAMFWDTGGIADVYMYVNDVRAVFAALRARGWQSYNDPVTYGSNRPNGATVTEIMIRGPNGEMLCLMQRLSPPYNKADFGLVEGDALGFGYPFNSALISKSFADGAHLFADILGWHDLFAGTSVSDPPGDNPLGLPKNLAEQYARKFAAYTSHPTDRNGSIQIMENVGLEGRDFSERAEPPNLGTLVLRVPVPDLKAFAANFAKKGGQLAVAPRKLDLPPYGRVDIMAIKAPNGARIEFFAKE